MWLYNAPPRQLLRERYGFAPDDAWLDHVRQSSVRFNSGGSGSFVSKDGLIVTNHHVGAGDLQKLSGEGRDYVMNGFHARTREEEKRCIDLELNVLTSMEDVTERVNAAIAPSMSAQDAFAARRAVMAQIEKVSLDATGLRSDIITLFGGGAYHLYRYKRYTDVRLVFAPEQQAAFFGGDPDNFEYPRYDLDICLFRAYENGAPAHITDWLKWSASGVSENELVFVSGHPGHTSRQLAMGELEYLRDEAFPFALAGLYRKEVALMAWSGRSDENARRARESLFGVQNGRKARGGMLAGLLEPALMASTREAENRLRDAISKSAELKDAAAAWDRIDAAQKIVAPDARASAMLEQARGFDSTLFHIARTLLRASEEQAKPSGDRLREYRDSNRESLELGLFSEEPIYDDFEIFKLEGSLTWLVEILGAENPVVKAVLVGLSPRERAAGLVAGTKLKDVGVRRSLYLKPVGSLAESLDPMLLLAQTIDPESRRLRKIGEAQDEVKRQAYAKIAEARFKLEGGRSYPDATFTLRLAFGAVRGYEEQGRPVPFQTQLRGLYARSESHQGKPPFDLPPRWVAAKEKLDLSTPLNFVSTADIIGGNSGSPVLNRAGEFVGIIFDGNIESCVLDFLYTDRKARAVSVNAQAIVEALRKVYDAGALADEIEGVQRR